MTGEGLAFTEERFILCEGRPDKGFLETLINDRNLPHFQIREASEFTGGKTGGRSAFGIFIEGCSALSGFSNLKGIAIVTDNDEEQTLRNIEKNLAKHGYKPSDAAGIGSIENKPVVIIPIPDQTTYGNLETFCLPVLYDTWPSAEECIKAYLECTGALSWEKQHELCKAVVRSIVAGYNENDPNKGLGDLFKNGTLSAKHPCFDRLADILNRFDEIVARGSF